MHQCQKIRIRATYSDECKKPDVKTFKSFFIKNNFHKKRSAEAFAEYSQYPDIMLLPSNYAGNSLKIKIAKEGKQLGVSVFRHT